MFTDMQVGTPEDIAEMAQKYPAWLKPRLMSSEYQGWFAIKDNAICAGAGALFLEWQPSVTGTDENYAYLLNVLLLGHYRGLKL